MGDMADDFRALREHRRERRREHRKKVPNVMQELRATGLKLEQFSMEHVRVWGRSGETYLDFWPSTGRWRSQSGRMNGFNVGPLKTAAELL